MGNTIAAFENFVKKYPESIYRDSAIKYMFSITIDKKDQKETERLLKAYPQHTSCTLVLKYLTEAAMETYSETYKTASKDIDEGTSKLNTEEQKNVFTNEYKESVDMLNKAVHNLKDAVKIHYADTTQIKKEISPLINKTDKLINYYISKNIRDKALDPGDKTIYNSRLSVLNTYFNNK